MKARSVESLQNAQSVGENFFNFLLLKQRVRKFLFVFCFLKSASKRKLFSKGKSFRLSGE